MIESDPFLLALIAPMLLASLLPAHGQAVPLFQALTIVVIAVMFFLQGRTDWHMGSPPDLSKPAC